jgi:hypothetical protein
VPAGSVSELWPSSSVPPPLPANRPTKMSDWNKSTFKRWLGAIGGLLILGFVKSSSGVHNNHHSATELVAESQTRAAAELRKQLPKKLDDVTTLRDVYAVGPAMFFRATLSKPLAESDKDKFEEEAAKRLTYNVCSSSMVSTLNAGGKYDYLYFDPEGRRIATIEITAVSCTDLPNAVTRKVF